MGRLRPGTGAREPAPGDRNAAPCAIRRRSRRPARRRDDAGARRLAITTDVEECRALLREGSPASLAAAVERHGGVLLDGFDAKSPSFEQWIEDHRRELRRDLLQALERAASHCAASGDLAGAIAGSRATRCARADQRTGAPRPDGRARAPRASHRRAAPVPGVPGRAATRPRRRAGAGDRSLVPRHSQAPARKRQCRCGGRRDRR